MEEFDVIIAGAGPAGGQCARELSEAGVNVLLAERHPSWTVNNYSSAGAPEELMHTYQLPESIVGSGWSKIQMHSSHTEHTWEDNKRRGVIMEFSQLRQFLAEEAKHSGAVVSLGFALKTYEQRKNGVVAHFKNHTSKSTETVNAKILVDATGVERQGLARHLGSQNNSFPSTGIEYLIEVSDEVYKKWENALSVFMGHKWMPQGYSWIFPMEPNKLKVGVGRYFQNDTFVPHNKSYTYYLDIMMQECLGSKEFPILDKHGKTLLYTYQRKDPHYDGNVIAIGDAVSTVNPLAYEGIRHAMYSGRVAAKHIIDKLDGNEDAFRSYTVELKNHFDFKWRLCESLMKMIYREPKDENIDLMLEAFRGFTIDEMIDLAFGYKLFAAMKFLSRYTLLKATSKVKAVLGRT